jgi:hypothetical protein
MGKSKYLGGKTALRLFYPLQLLKNLLFKKKQIPQTLNLSHITSKIRIVAIFVIVELLKIFCALCIGMFMIHLQTKFHLLSSNV